MIQKSFLKKPKSTYKNTIKASYLQKLWDHQKKRSTMTTDKISTHLDIKPIGKEPCPKKGINQENCQLSTVIVDGVKYTNVPEKTRKEIEKIAKMYGKIRK